MEIEKNVYWDLKYTIVATGSQNSGRINSILWEVFDVFISTAK